MAQIKVYGLRSTIEAHRAQRCFPMESEDVVFPADRIRGVPGDALVISYDVDV